VRSKSRAGFTLIEALFALALFAIVVVKITMVLDSAADASSQESSTMTLEDQARRVLDQVAYKVMGADRNALFPDPESPNFSTEVEFQASFGMDAGEEVFGPMEWIGAEGSQVVHKDNPELPEERRVALSNDLRQFFAGEVENGADDNGNGLSDEDGLTFSLHGNAVTIRLCLERSRREGDPIVQYVETVVTVRN
jgi:prepilin-type N-terminal cleavage/methylation domain-containing protein